MGWGGGGVVGVSEYKANSAKLKFSLGLACAEFGNALEVEIMGVVNGQR